MVRRLRRGTPSPVSPPWPGYALFHACGAPSAICHPRAFLPSDVWDVTSFSRRGRTATHFSPPRCGRGFHNTSAPCHTCAFRCMEYHRATRRCWLAMHLFTASMRPQIPHRLRHLPHMCLPMYGISPIYPPWLAGHALFTAVVRPLPSATHEPSGVWDVNSFPPWPDGRALFHRFDAAADSTTPPPRATGELPVWDVTNLPAAARPAMHFFTAVVRPPQAHRPNPIDNKERLIW